MGTFYGPYAQLRPMYTLLEMFSQLFTLRTCNLNLTPENIEAKKFKVCLEYHIGNCKGPCEGLVSEADYLKDIDQIHSILKEMWHQPSSISKNACWNRPINWRLNRHSSTRKN